jgi:predicted transcriptional regulator with HTH domain
VKYVGNGMQDRSNHSASPEVLRPLVVRSLRRSNVRKKIAEYLFDISPSGSYTSEIAYHVKTTPTNVIGAIRGMDSRYRRDESLIHLNIVEQISNVETADIKLYRLTDFGKDIVETLKMQR